MRKGGREGGRKGGRKGKGRREGWSNVHYELQIEFCMMDIPQVPQSQTLNKKSLQCQM